MASGWQVVLRKLWLVPCNKNTHTSTHQHQQKMLLMLMRLSADLLLYSNAYHDLLMLCGATCLSALAWTYQDCGSVGATVQLLCHCQRLQPHLLLYAFLQCFHACNATITTTIATTTNVTTTTVASTTSITPFILYPQVTPRPVGTLTSSCQTRVRPHC